MATILLDDFSSGTSAAGKVVTPPEAARGFVLRPQRDDDATFLLDLFRSHAAEGLAAVPIEMRNRLIAMQFNAQAASYRTQYPEARFDIVERDAAPIGRLVLDVSAATACVVDIALLAEHRGQGLGPALLTQVLTSLPPHVIAMRCMVVWHNERSLRMFRRLGFVALDDAPYRTLAWQRPICASTIRREVRDGTAPDA